jgi:hypothetical protein
MEAVRQRRARGAGVVGVSEDLIERYLAELRGRLRTSPQAAEEILAEAVDHLRESQAAGLAIGMTEQEAQEAAISAFGSVRAVARAHRRLAPVVEDTAVMACGAFASYLLTVFAVSMPVYFWSAPPSPPIRPGTRSRRRRATRARPCCGPAPEPWVSCCWPVT